MENKDILSDIVFSCGLYSFRNMVKIEKPNKIMKKQKEFHKSSYLMLPKSQLTIKTGTAGNKSISDNSGTATVLLPTRCDKMIQK